MSTAPLFRQNWTIANALIAFSLLTISWAGAQGKKPDPAGQQKDNGKSHEKPQNSTQKKASQSSKDQGKCIKGDCQNGTGTYVWINGHKYIGHWQKGKRHGQGKYIWPKGKVYQGQWQNNQQHGDGTMYWPNGERYKGKWQKGKMSGIGRYYFPNGAMYAGEFKDNKPHGKGILYNKDEEKVFQGIWRNGKPKKRLEKVPKP